MFANSAGQSRTSFLAIYVSAANSKITLERRENRDKKRGLIFTRITASLMARTNRVSRLRRHGTSNENRVARYSSYVRKQTRVGVEGMAPSAKSVLICKSRTIFLCSADYTNNRADNGLREISGGYT